MRKSIAVLVVGAAFAVAPAAQAQVLYVADPTPTQSFSGTYQCGWETYKDENGQTQYTLDENGDRIPVYCDQEGHVAVYEDGVEACNGNENITRPDDGSPLVGYVWIGPGRTASNPTAASPGNLVGAGNNHETADGEPTGDSPCSSNGG